MTFLHIFTKLGVQPIAETKKQAIVTINGKRYQITHINYINGHLDSFEAEEITKKPKNDKSFRV